MQKLLDEQAGLQDQIETANGWELDRTLEDVAVLQVCRDLRGPERVMSDLGFDAGGLCGTTTARHSLEKGDVGEQISREAFTARFANGTLIHPRRRGDQRRRHQWQGRMRCNDRARVERA